MKKVYLSGPMTGLPENNYPAFRRAAQSLRGEGFHVYDPSEWCEVDQEFDLRAAFKDYTHWIIDHADAVVVLPGHEDSKGARAETALAHAIGKPVLTLLGAILESREGR